MKIPPPLKSFLLVAATAAFLAGCNAGGPDQNNTSGTDSANVSNGGLLKFQGEIFSIPSPVHTAILVQKSNLEFDPSVLNPVENKNNYVSEVKKALNLGVYGADLAYLSNFNNPAMSQKYFEVMGSLAKDLNVLENIDQGLLQRFVNNMNNRDSLFSLNADFYKEGDRYLKNSERHQVAALILVGGWVEALHIACNAATSSAEVRSKVGEQRSALQGLTRVMQKYDDDVSTDITSKLQELSNVMSQLESTYEYNKPITDKLTKTTYLTSRTSVVVDDSDLADISSKVSQIRNTIIQ